VQSWPLAHLETLADQISPRQCLNFRFSHLVPCFCLA
jgi:hypothetical protein